LKEKDKNLPVVFRFSSANKKLLWNSKKVEPVVLKERKL